MPVGDPAHVCLAWIKKFAMLASVTVAVELLDLHEEEK